MEWAIPTIAVVVLAFAAVSRPPRRHVDHGGDGLHGRRTARAERRSPGSSSRTASGETVKLLAEATLAVVLFGDASRIDLRALCDRSTAVPARLLGIGLPLTIVAGFARRVARARIDWRWPEALLLAVVLAPTDAALGQAVVTSRACPRASGRASTSRAGSTTASASRCFIDRARGRRDRGGRDHRVTRRPAGGSSRSATACSSASSPARSARPWSCLAAARPDSSTATGCRSCPVAAAALAYAAAAAVGGSGFIAAFVGGIVFGGITAPGRRRGRRYLVEETRRLLNARRPSSSSARSCSAQRSTTSLARRALRAAQPDGRAHAAGRARACSARARRPPTVAFLGWFGPRGLASIVFAVIVLEEADAPARRRPADDDLRHDRASRCSCTADRGAARTPLRGLVGGPSRTGEPRRVRRGPARSLAAARHEPGAGLSSSPGEGRTDVPA